MSTLTPLKTRCGILKIVSKVFFDTWCLR